MTCGDGSSSCFQHARSARHIRNAVFPYAGGVSAVFDDPNLITHVWLVPVLRLAEREHRHHAVVEQVIADSKAAALARLPSGCFHANPAWLTLWVMTYNLLRSAGFLASAFHAKATTATMRTHPSGPSPGPHRPLSAARRSAPDPQLALAARLGTPLHHAHSPPG